MTDGSPGANREWHLVRRPKGWPVLEDFRLVKAPVPAPGPGAVLVRNQMLSVDPAMRLRMDEEPAYAIRYELNVPLGGGAVGMVTDSRSPEVPVGSTVQHRMGWREWAVVPVSEATVVYPDVDGLPVAAYLGPMGATGLTAWVGVFDVLDAKPGETMYVSAAAGAVGGIAGQLAIHSGLRVIGSAGTAAKVEWLKKAGFHGAFDYHDGVRTCLQVEAPEGIDCYFDNVGGAHLESALDCLKPFGRIAACGMITSYNGDAVTPANLFQIVAKRAVLRGFLVGDHGGRRDLASRHIKALIRRGSLNFEYTIRSGIEAAPEALFDLLRGGRHLGKMVISLD